MSGERELSPKHVLITGVNGLVGSILREALATDYAIIGVDRAGQADDRATFTVDLSDLGGLRQLFERLEPIDTIIHLAANPSPEAAWEVILRDNITATRNVYECAHNFKVRRVIFAGSTHTFGGYTGYPNASPLGRPITPTDPPRSDSDYGDSKAYGEVLARRYYDLHGVETITLRLGQVTRDDKPTAPYAPLWISHRDLAQVFRCALMAEVSFGTFFATSGNQNSMFDTTSTQKELHFRPVD